FGDGRFQIVVQVDPPRPPTEVEGWAVVEGEATWRPFSPGVVADYRRPATEVRAYAESPPPGGRLLGSADYGLRRDDVAAFYGGFPAIAAVGYRLLLPGDEAPEETTPLMVCAMATRAEITCVALSTGR